MLIEAMLLKDIGLRSKMIDLPFTTDRSGISLPT